MCDSNGDYFTKYTVYPGDYSNATLRGRPVTLSDGSPSWVYKGWPDYLSSTISLISDSSASIDSFC